MSCISFLFSSVSAGRCVLRTGFLSLLMSAAACQDSSPDPTADAGGIADAGASGGADMTALPLTGAPVFSKRLIGDGTETIRTIVVDKLGDVIVGGTFSARID